MRAQPDDHRPSRRNFGILCMGTLLAMIILLLIFTSGLPFTTRRGVSDAALLAGGLFAAVSCGARCWSATGRRRTSWLFFALGSLSAAAGNGWILIVHATGMPDSAGSPSDLLFVLALLFAIAALTAFPSVKRRGADLVRILFDGIVIGGSLLTIAGVTIFPQLLNPVASGTGGVVTLVFSVVDIMVATLAAMLVVRGDRSDRTVLLFVGGGAALYAISDLFRAVLSAKGTFAFGGPVDAGWILGYALFALAARHHTASGHRVPASPSAATPPLVTSAVTFGLFLIAALARVLLLPEATTTPLTSAVWLVVLLAITVRQLLLIIDNESLRRGLEHRVEERTSELKALTQSSETMLHSVADGIYGVDRAGFITFINPSAAAMLGRREDELIGQHAHDLFHHEQEDGSPFPYQACYIYEAIRDEVTTTSEEDTYARADAATFAVEVTASPLIRDDAVEGAVVVFRDMTQRREVDRLKSEFVSVVSHELRTPLTSIRGSLGLLSAGALGELTPAARRMVEIALDSSERLTRLINDILDIERIESGTMPMKMDRELVATLVRSAVDQIQPIAAEAQVRLVVEQADGEVYADGDRIVQTLVNLLGNAVKFSPPDSTVEVSAGPDPDRTKMIIFRVADHGRGIPTDRLETIFRRFEQVDSSDAREKGGSGLGLAISRSIVERHGGQIKATSIVGEGSQFVFDIPRSEAAGMAEMAQDEPGGPLVLVCDDDPSFVEVICAMLHRKGYRTIGVTDGDRAITLAAERQPAAVLLDLMMEGRGGAEVVEAIRCNPASRDIPLLVVSGLDPSTDEELAAETDDWLVKPVEESRLMHALGTSIAEHQRISGDVLIVEDDEAVASVVRTLLERRGMRVAHARTQAEALEAAHEIRPEVLILDLQLQDGSGVGLVRDLRADHSLAELPTIVYSASDVPSDQRRELQLGTTVFLTKGRVSPQTLETRVLELVDLVARQDRPTRSGSPTEAGDQSQQRHSADTYAS